MIADDRKKSKDRSPERRELSWQVLDSLTSGIAVLDKSGTIVAINDAWKQFCLQNEGSLEKTGVGVNYLDVCRRAKGEDAELANRAGRGIEEVINGERDIFKLEYPCHSHTEQRWFLLYVSRLKENDHGVVTVHLSITDRKLIEQQLVETERLAAIGQAMQGLSHEGRNALQRAQASIDLLRFHVLQDYEALKLVERIENAQRHLLSLYEEVKSYAAPIRLKRQHCRLDQLVQQVWANIASRSDEASFSHNPSSDDLTCEVDAAAISEILQIVFENALATAAPSPNIEVSYAPDEINGAAAVTVIMSDNGPGVAPEVTEKAFELFFTTKQRGTGLGLAICKRIASAHGGRIYFGEPLNGGASVYLTLPVCVPK